MQIFDDWNKIKYNFIKNLVSLPSSPLLLDLLILLLPEFSAFLSTWRWKITDQEASQSCPYGDCRRYSRCSWLCPLQNFSVSVIHFIWRLDIYIVVNIITKIFFLCISIVIQIFLILSWELILQAIGADLAGFGATSCPSDTCNRSEMNSIQLVHLVGVGNLVPDPGKDLLHPDLEHVQVSAGPLDF